MLFLSTLFLYWLFLCFSVNSVIINTNYGSIQGLETLRNQKIHHSFKKIPFAKPPLGNLRFQKPESPDLWTEIKDGTAYGPACMSNSTTSKSPQEWVDEDCLHLNIFVSNYCLKFKNCSVAVYIHGGDLVYDSAVMFNDTYLFDSFTSRDVILVLPGFRLGIFSHLTFSNQDIAPYNIAIHDILKALEFVHSEIQHFGGDPNSVTAMGHSYGGIITGHMLFSTEINMDLSLFQKVVSMSAYSLFQSVEKLQKRTDIFVKRAGCYSDSQKVFDRDLYVLQCLQTMDSHKLLRIQRELEEEDENFLFEGVVQALPLFQPGSLHEFHQNPKKIPYMTGVLSKEFDFENKENDFDAVGDILNFKNKEDVYKKYLDDKISNRLRFNHTMETLKFFVDTEYRVLKVLETGAPVYLYEYTNPTHALHSDDLSYIMGVHQFNKTADEQKLSEVYPEYFMNFIKFGKPAGNWEVSNGTTYFDIDWSEETGRRPRMKNGFEQEIIDYWFIEMRNFDNSIEKSKTIHPKFKSSLLNTEHLPSTIDTNLVFWLSSSLIFIVGIIVGRYMCAPKRNLYVQIPGNDYYEAVKM